MTLITTVLAFLLALGPLIIFHELGHYTVARLCGVKVLRFSVGMGKVVWSRRFGPDQTEWAVSMLPLGGYVKMLDARDPDAPAMNEADLQREFTRQNVWRRIAIVAAGPLANFLLAIVLFAALAMAGTVEPSTRLRAPAEKSVAYQAGLRGGEKVAAVNGKAVASWTELRWEIMQAIVDKRDARLDVTQPQGGQFGAILPASALKGLDVEGDLLAALGLDMARPKPVIEKIIAGGPGERAGLQVGDLVTAIDGQPVIDGIAVIEAIRAANGRSLALSLERAGAPVTASVKPEFDAARKAWVIKIVTSSMPEQVTVTSGPVEAVAKAAAKTWDTSVLSVKMIGQHDYRRSLVEKRHRSDHHCRLRGTDRAHGPLGVFGLHRLHQHQSGRDESVTNSGAGWGAFAVLFAGSFDRTPLARTDWGIRAARRNRPAGPADGPRCLQRRRPAPVDRSYPTKNLP